MECHIFYQACCSRLAHSSNCRKNSRADRPISGVFFWIISKLDLAIGIKSGKTVCHSLDNISQFVLRPCFNSYKYSSKPLHFPCIYRSQRSFIQHLCGGDIKWLHSNNSTGGFCHILEIHHCISFKRSYRQCIHYHFTYERESSFRADKQMKDDIKWICECNQG